VIIIIFIIIIIIIISGYYKDSLSQQKYVIRTFIMWDCGTDLSLIREQPTGFLSLRAGENPTSPQLSFPIIITAAGHVIDCS